MNSPNLNLYSIIAGIALMLVGLLGWVLQDPIDGVSLWGYAALGLGVLILVFGLWESRHGLKGGMRRSTRTGFQVGTMIVVVTGILAVVELVSIKHNKRWDLTPGSYFTLSRKTLQILDKLEAEKKRIEIISFTPKIQNEAIKKVLEQYSRRTKMVKSRFVDLDSAPRTAKKYDVDSYGTIVVVHRLEKDGKKSGKAAGDAKAGGKEKKSFRSEKFFDLSENSIANAILKTIQTDQKRVFFLTGHGERLHVGRGRQLMATLATNMRDDNYKVDELFLLRKKGVPKDTKLLVIAAPRKDIEEAESGFIEKYLNGGGRLLALLEPETPQGRLTDLLKKFGVDAPESFVIDPQAVQFALVGGNELTPFVTQYGVHDITKQMRGMASMFPTARRISAKSDPKKGVSTEILAWTGKGSFTVGRIEVKDQQVSYDPATKKDGPVSLGAAVTVDLEKFLPKSTGEVPSGADNSKNGGKKEARIVVFGDADFASDAFIGAQGNGNLILNSVNWLSGEKALVTIRAKRRVGEPLLLAGGQAEFVRMFTVWVMPLLVILFGAAVYVRRRQLQ
ncbi:MAG TPA: Gldg family protein [Nitrospinota bacterium]|nr:Gldg family protein [Nitrospinota bacterium]